MALLKIKCPECNAGLKSPTGFTAGQSVCCPKCETYFAVEEPAEDEDDNEPKAKPSKGKDTEKPAPAGKKPLKAAVADDEDDEEKNDEKPKKKKKKKAVADDEDGGSYKKSPLRFIILGVLLLVMVALGVMLYLKKQREAAAEKQREADAATATAALKAREENPPPRKDPPKVNPKVNPKVIPKPGGGKGPDLGVLTGDTVGGLFGGPVPFEEAQKLTRKYTAALVGTWAADLGNGVTEALIYKPDGTFTANRPGSPPLTLSGKYMVTTLVGTKAMKLQLDTAAGARTVTIVFEEDELLHPSLQQGVSAAFRKK